MARDGYIYIIKEGGSSYYKIGVSKSSTYARLKILQVGNPRKLEVILETAVSNYLELENELHKYYKDLNINGEWFILNEVLLKEIIKKIKAREKTNNIIIQKRGDIKCL